MVSDLCDCRQLEIITGNFSTRLQVCRLVSDMLSYLVSVRSQSAVLKLPARHFAGILSMVLDPRLAGLDPQGTGAYKKEFVFQLTSRPADELDEVRQI